MGLNEMLGSNKEIGEVKKRFGYSVAAFRSTVVSGGISIIGDIVLLGIIDNNKRALRIALGGDTLTLLFGLFFVLLIVNLVLTCCNAYSMTQNNLTLGTQGLMGKGHVKKLRIISLPPNFYQFKYSDIVHVQRWNGRNGVEIATRQGESYQFAVENSETALQMIEELSRQ